MEELKQQALTEHLAELRSCLIISLAAVFAASCLCYAYGKELGAWFVKPLAEVLPGGTSLVFTSYQEGFFFI